MCRYKIKFYLITVLLFILAGSVTVAGPKNDRNPANSSINKNAIKLLFVGNSLTYTNNLPDLVEQSGKDSGLYIIAEVLAYPDYALEDHWMDGLVQQRIANGHVDFVVAQQGPSSQQEGRKMLHDYGTKLNNLCDSHNTKLMFFMVWPSIANYTSFEGVIKNYTDAARSANAILCPVGQYWYEYIKSANDFSYYGADKFHPSLKGSKVAANLIVSAVKRHYSKKQMDKTGE